MYDTLWEMIRATSRDRNIRVVTAEADDSDPREWLYALDMAEFLKPEDSSLN
jgi:hypothetical protein